MNAEEIIGLLNQEPEMNPDAHDGSYELMREIVKAYSKLEDYSSINFKDLNAVYAMAIKMFELYTKGLLSSEKCIEALKNKTGLLSIADLVEDK